MSKIKLRSLTNVRDLGGIQTKYGVVKSKKLLRSPALDKLTTKDIDILVNKYNLATIIDLRTDKEIEEKADLEIKDVKYLHMPIFNKTLPGISHESESDNDITRFREIEIDMADLYRGIVTEEYLKKVGEIIKFIVNMKDEEFAVIFHCTAGKDRTGIIATILLLILGAEKHTIIDDYLLTNIEGKRRMAKEYWTIRMLKGKETADKVKKIMVADLRYINQVFDVIENDWGGVDRFLYEGLNLTKEEMERFRKKMLE